jgi:hypothetical protein
LLEDVRLWIYDVHGLGGKSSGRKFISVDVAIWDIGMSENRAKRASWAWREICWEIRFERYSGLQMNE